MADNGDRGRDKSASINSKGVGKKDGRAKELLPYIKTRLEESKRIRRQLAPWGKISIDRQLPFLTVYRKPEGTTSFGDERLVMGEASYVTASGARRHHSALTKLVSEVVSTLSEKFGAFLILEVWVSAVEATEDMPARPPHFKIHLPQERIPRETVNRLERSLKRIRVHKQPAIVDVVPGSRTSPPGMLSLISMKKARQLNAFTLGVEVLDVYRDSHTKNDFPLILQVINRELTRAMRHSFFEFTQKHTTYRPRNFQQLGPRSIVKSVFDIDHQLATISGQFDLVLAATPTNYNSAFEEFKKEGFQKEPHFTYRPVAVEPADLKRRLYEIRIDRVEDPALAQLFREQQKGIDRQISMLSDRGTANFLYGSMQLFGVPNDTHVELARHVLDTVPVNSRDESLKESLSAKEFAREAKQELRFYQQKYPDFEFDVELREDVSGVMVSSGNLLINPRSRIPETRVRAILQHEIGTHVVTFYNGRLQPFQQMASGLVGYDEVQEGLAVLAEYLSGGLTRRRMRMLAARVVAVRMMLNGADYIQVFRELTGTYRFGNKLAFNLVTRVFRSGGFTKDAVYLRGLIWLLEYLKNDGDLDALFVGKMPQIQLPLVKELLWRRVLKKPVIVPRYLRESDAGERLERIRQGMTLAEFSKSLKLS
ncbi:MAG: flavohemoglobin expression-modulating QEGLA motif protein [Cyanobacteriota/Melainabacteria group bacterium]